MSLAVTCPECQTKFEIEPSAPGSVVRCVGCGKEFPISVAPSPIVALPPKTGPRTSDQFASPADLPLSSPGPRTDDEPGAFDDLDVSRPNLRTRWSSTLNGLKLMYWAVVLLLLSNLLIQGVALTNIAGEPAHRAMDPVGGLTSCVSLIGIILAFVGACLCCAAPDPRASRRALTALILVLAAVVAAILLVVLLLSSFIEMMRDGRDLDLMRLAEVLHVLGGTGVVGIVIVMALTLVAFVFWVLFHVAIADEFDNPHLRKQALVLLAMWLVVSAVGWIVQIGGALAAPPGTPNHESAQYVQHGYALVQTVLTFAWYLKVCGETIRTIDLGTR